MTTGEILSFKLSFSWRVSTKCSHIKTVNLRMSKTVEDFYRSLAEVNWQHAGTQDLKNASQNDSWSFFIHLELGGKVKKIAWRWEKAGQGDLQGWNTGSFTRSCDLQGNYASEGFEIISPLPPEFGAEMPVVKHRLTEKNQQKFINMDTLSRHGRYPDKEVA